MRSSYKLSQEGITEIESARRKKGWKKVEENWMKQGYSSGSTLKRFLRGERISAEHFIDLCKAVGIEDWQKVVDWEDNDSTSVPESTQERLSTQKPKTLSPDVDSETARYRLAVSAVFDAADLEEIEITIDHLLKLMVRGTVTLKTQDGKEIKEIKHLRQD